MKRITLILALLVFCGVSINAQFSARNLTFGGGLGLQFGDYTLVNFAPQVGYNFNRYMNLGAGINYTYFSEKFDHKTFKETNHYLGMNVYARIYPIQYIVLAVQPEVNRMWKSVKNLRTGDKSNTNDVIPTCLVGAGIRMGPVTAMLQYDLVQNDNSPYGTRIFYSVGYTFGF